MTFDEFLHHTSIIKMLYGASVAQKFYENNVALYYNLDSASLSNLVKDNA